MRHSTSALPRALVIAAALAVVAALPQACAEGTTWNGGLTGPTTGSGGSADVTTSTTSGRAGLGGMGGAGGAGGAGTTSGQFPDGATTAAGTTTSGFPSTSTTTSGFPSTSAATSTSATSSSVSSTASSSSGGPSSACDSIDCDVCGECAGCGPCISEALNCEFDNDCSTILCCSFFCSPNDAACLAECISEDPAGEGLFNAYALCLLCACQQTCAVPAGTCP